MGAIALRQVLKVRNNVRSSVVAIRREYRDDPDPVDLYCNNGELFQEKYLRSNNRRGGNGLCAYFLEISQDVWLFVKAVKWKAGREQEKYGEYAGRLMVHFHKTNHSGDINLRAQIGRMTIHSILESKYGTTRFPGYYETRLTFQQLQDIFRRKLTDWKEALQSIFAIYLITDRKGGAYVGSATGENGLWGRWAIYAGGRFAGHANDVGLVERIGSDSTYPNNFVFTILEVFDMKKSRDEIVKREGWWKDTLRTRVKYGNKGMNEN